MPTCPTAPLTVGKTVSRRLVRLCCLPVFLWGCSPALNWREVRPEGWSLMASLPCRPDVQERRLLLAGESVQLAMQVCSAQGHTFALSSAVMPNPASVGPALRALALAAKANLGGDLVADQPATVPGMTPQADARRLRITGRLPDGQAVTEELLLFAHGQRVLQAAVVGPQTLQLQVQPFVDALRVVP